MAKEQLYFKNEDADLCWSLKHHLQEAQEDGLEEIELFEAIVDKDDDYFWCSRFCEVTMTNENACGKHCSGYEPQNGKSGKCKSKQYCHTWGEKIKFKLSDYPELLLPTPLKER